MTFVDAPVSGGQRGAQEGTLSIMVGADPDVFEDVRPLLETIASRVIRIGGPGAGQVAKAANQIVVGLTIQAVAEALPWRTDRGTSTSDGSARRCWAGSRRARCSRSTEAGCSTRFEPGGRLTLHLKAYGSRGSWPDPSVPRCRRRTRSRR